MPQVLPVLQEALELKEDGLPPLNFEAKVETFLRTCLLWHAGQTTSLVALALRTSSSKESPHSRQVNSKIGINSSRSI